MSFKDEEIEAANSASVAADLDPDTGIEIDRYGRYRLPKPPAERNGIMPVPATGRTRSFTRVTTLVSALEYAGSLTEWKLRRVTEGLGRRHDLWLRARAAGMRPEVDEDELRVVIPEAFAAGGGDVGASRGTAIHAATVALDHGHDRPPVDPGDHEAVLVDRDLTAYQLLLEDARITVPDLAELAGTGTEELVCVLPGLEVAGRFDKIRMIDGRLVIVDLKTEKDRPGTYGGLKVAMQLACYARAEWIYDQKEKVYRPIPAVSRDIGYVIWLPRGRGIAELLSIDLRTGWHWVRTAVEVRASRRVKDLVIPHSRADVTALTPTPPRPEVVAQIPEPEPESSAPPQPPAPAPASAPVQAETSRKPGRRCGKCGQPGHNARTCIGAPPSPDPKVKDLGNGLALCRHTSGWTRREGDDFFSCPDCGRPGADFVPPGREIKSQPEPAPEPEPAQEPEPAPAPAFLEPQPAPAPAPERIYPPGLLENRREWADRLMDAQTTQQLSKVYEEANNAGVWDKLLFGIAQDRFNALR